MIIQCASKTEVVPAIAVHRGHYPCEFFAFDGTFHGVFAVGSGAPLEVLSVVDVSSCQEDLISTES